MNILVTGANGFVGQALCTYITDQGFNAYGLLRKKQENLNAKQQFIVEDFLNHSDWKPLLQGMNAVIHTAGLAHVKGRPDSDYFTINTEITKKLASECVKNGVKRFVYVSSIHVHASSESSSVLTSQSPFNPQTAYGKSKLFAEQTLREIEKETGLEVVIIRPPLVYGPQVAGNVLTLLKSIQKGIPFPFAKAHNKRSMVFVQNLVDALVLCASHPNAGGNTFLISDGQDLSIEQLIQGLAKGMGKKAYLFYFPDVFLKIPCKILGKSDILNKIIGSLQVDHLPLQNILGWQPLVSAEKGLQETGRAFQSSP